MQSLFGAQPPSKKLRQNTFPSQALELEGCRPRSNRRRSPFSLNLVSAQKRISSVTRFTVFANLTLTETAQRLVPTFLNWTFSSGNYLDSARGLRDLAPQHPLDSDQPSRLAGRGPAWKEEEAAALRGTPQSCNLKPPCACYKRQAPPALHTAGEQAAGEGPAMKHLMVLLGLAYLAASCQSQGVSPASSPQELDSAREAGQQEEEEEEPFYKSPVNKLAAAVSNFGYALFRQQSGQTPSANVLLSPFSVATALSALSLGAGERTEDVISRALFYDTLDKANLHSTYKGLLGGIGAHSKGLKTVSRLVMERKLRMRMAFVNELEKSYGFRPRVLSGNARADLQEINQWVQQRTGGKVVRFLGEIPAGLSILLLGAASFKGQWATRFDPKLTKPQDFHLDEDRSTQVPMMSAPRAILKYGFDSELSCKIAQLPLAGGLSAMFFLPEVPTHNFTLIEESLSAQFVHDINKQLKTVQATLRVPRLRLVAETRLGEALQEMRLQALFSTPNLAKISAKALRLSHAQHKVALELGEDGASAVFALETEAARLSFPIAYTLDRPFLFVLYDDDTGTLLFIGKILDPQQA